MQITDSALQIEYGKGDDFYLAILNVYNNQVLEVVETHWECPETGDLFLTDNPTLATAQAVFNEWLEEKEAEVEADYYDEDTNLTIDKAIEYRHAYGK